MSGTLVTFQARPDVKALNARLHNLQTCNYQLLGDGPITPEVRAYLRDLVSEQQAAARAALEAARTAA